MKSHPFRWALLASAAALAYQLFMVYGPYGGNWTGLFCFGSTFPVPDGLAGMNIRVVTDTGGYDGQFYYYMAQDPFLYKGYASGIDVPRFRYRRILVPLAAHILAAGRPAAIAISYAGVMLASVFLGTYWLARFAALNGRHPAWGCAFLFVPAVLISLDRSTVDGALAALCVAFALYVAEEKQGRLFAVLAAAPLVRETGLLLLAAFCGAEFLSGRLRRSMIFAAAAIPTFAWYAFVHMHTAPFQEPMFDPVPLRNLLGFLVAPTPYPAFGALAWLPQGLDRLALLGMPVAFGLSLAKLPGSVKDPLRLAVLLFTFVGIWHSAPGTWSDTFGHARSFTPLLLLLALDGLRNYRRIDFIPILLPLPRIGLQLAGQIIAGTKALL